MSFLTILLFPLVAVYGVTAATTTQDAISALGTALATRSQSALLTAASPEASVMGTSPQQQQQMSPANTMSGLNMGTMGGLNMNPLGGMTEMVAGVVKNFLAGQGGMALNPLGGGTNLNALFNIPTAVRQPMRPVAAAAPAPRAGMMGGLPFNLMSMMFPMMGMGMGMGGGGGGSPFGMMMPGMMMNMMDNMMEMFSF